MQPISKPVLAGNEWKYLYDAINKVQLTWSGEYVQKFEKQFADFCGVRHALTTCNGTSALHLALLALGVNDRWDVYVPSLTYVATANAAQYCHANVITVDVDATTWCMSSSDLVTKLRRRTVNGRNPPSVIVPVHLYGVPASMNMINNIARSFDARVVEDAAQAHGASLRGHRVGSLGEIGTFSFYGNKIITTGEGGMVTTNNTELYDRMVKLRGHAMSATQRYFHEEVGYNYRMTNLQAALGVAQLEQFELFSARRALLFESYQSQFEGKLFFQMSPAQSQCGHWLFSVLLPASVKRDDVAKKLLQQGIETRPVFPTIESMPMYSYNPPSRIAGVIAETGLNLPTHVDMSVDDTVTIVRAVLKEVFGESVR